jgi:hypothetical protein
MSIVHESHGALEHALQFGTARRGPARRWQIGDGGAPKKSPLRERAESIFLEENRGDE